MALKDVYAKPLASLDSLGEQLAFHLGVLKAVPRSVTLAPGATVQLAALVEWLGGFPVVVKTPGGEGGQGTMCADSLPEIGRASCRERV